MLRWILRTLLILAAAGLICGGLYLFSRSSQATAISAGPDGERFGAQLAAGSAQGGQTGSGAFPLDGRQFEGPHGGHDQASLGRGLGEVFQSLLVVAVVVLAVSGLQKLWALLPKRARA